MRSGREIEWIDACNPNYDETQKFYKLLSFFSIHFLVFGTLFLLSPFVQWKRNETVKRTEVFDFSAQKMKHTMKCGSNALIFSTSNELLIVKLSFQLFRRIFSICLNQISFQHLCVILFRQGNISEWFRRNPFRTTLILEYIIHCE